MDDSSTFVSALALGAGALVIAISRILRRRLDADSRFSSPDVVDGAFAVSGAALLLGTILAPALLPALTSLFRWAIFVYMVLSVIGEVREARREQSTGS